MVCFYFFVVVWKLIDIYCIGLFGVVWDFVLIVGFIGNWVLVFCVSCVLIFVVKRWLISCFVLVGLGLFWIMYSEFGMNKVFFLFFFWLGKMIVIGLFWLILIMVLFVLVILNVNFLCFIEMVICLFFESIVYCLDILW